MPDGAAPVRSPRGRPSARRPSGTEIAIVGALAAGGAILTVALARRVGMDWATTLQLVGVAAGAALATALAGTAVLLALRKRSIAARTAVVAVTSIGAVAVGASAAAGRMFITAHDLDALAVILAAAATAGVVVVAALGWEVGRATRSLRDAARRIGEGDLRSPIERPRAAEFAELATELQAMAARLDEAIGRERSADASRRELVAWISHDLRTPLAAILAIAEALEDGVVDEPEEVVRYCRTLRREAERLSALVDDLFELSRISSGSLRLDLRPVGLEDVVSGALAAASALASAKGVVVEGRMLPERAAGTVGHGETVALIASTPEVSRALSNLLDNGIRHTPPGGRVLVEAGVEGGTAFVAVEDGCGGIPPNDLDRVFEPAFRGEPARTPAAPPRAGTVGAGSGAGLGLAIARGLVEAHHGDITVANVRGGCRFVMRLPVAAGAGARSNGSS